MDWQADSDRSSPHERSRSRDADQHPDTRPQTVDSRAKHRELPDCGTEAEERTRQKASATPNFCATPPRTVRAISPRTVRATPPRTVRAISPRTVPATDKVTQELKKRPHSKTTSRVSKPDSEAAQASTGPRMYSQDSPYIEPQPLPGSTVAKLRFVKTHESRDIRGIDAICDEWHSSIHAHLDTLRSQREDLRAAMLENPDERWRSQ
jgi:hypothetical protein